MRTTRQQVCFQVMALLCPFSHLTDEISTHSTQDVSQRNIAHNVLCQRKKFTNLGPSRTHWTKHFTFFYKRVFRQDFSQRKVANWHKLNCATECIFFPVGFLHPSFIPTPSPGENLFGVFRFFVLKKELIQEHCFFFFAFANLLHFS